MVLPFGHFRTKEGPDVKDGSSHRCLRQTVSRGHEQPQILANWGRKGGSAHAWIRPGGSMLFSALIFKTRKLSYRKDDRAMACDAPYVWVAFGCPENFRESLTTPTATFPEIFNGLLFRLSL